MTATNHALTGALIGLTVGDPLIAVPAALASHFICDAIPHFGPSGDDNVYIASRRFKLFLTLEALLCLSIVLILYFIQPQHWFVGAVCAFLAASPDFMFVGKFLRARAGKEIKRPSAVIKFHESIQWFAKPIGALVEAAWAVSTIILLKLFIV